MRLINLEIHNFRGIQNAKIDFPMDNRFICLIGAGDSTKSTILLSLEWLFSQTWNLPICDNDFYLANTENKITICGTFTEFPDYFLAEDKFGLFLRKPGIPYDGITNDEPADGEPLCLTIQFTADSSLEPHWNVVCNRNDPKTITNKERAQLAVGCVGENCARDMTWGRYSVLQKYADSKGVLHNAYTKAMREAAANTDLDLLDGLSDDIKSIGGRYGVGFENDIKSKLLIQSGSFTTSAGLYDGQIPLNLRGVGSQRLLSIGLNIKAYSSGTVLLIDEIECGLEPYRLRSLINELRNQTGTSGQVIITTHSPVVLTECSASELVIVHSRNGNTNVFYFNKSDEKVYEQLQKQIRSDADAFLCKALIVCEGKTEYGFVKAFDDFIAQNLGIRMAHKGVGIALGGGDTTFAYADSLRDRGYEISIFMDSDKESDAAEKEKRRRLYGTTIFDWDNPNAIEQQLFLDLPESLIQQLIDITVDEKGATAMAGTLYSEGISFDICEDGTKLILNDFSQVTRLTLGKLAKQKGKNGRIGEWYKRIDLGREIGQIIFEHWSEIDQSTKLFQTVSSMIEWVKNL